MAWLKRRGWLLILLAVLGLLLLGGLADTPAEEGRGTLISRLREASGRFVGFFRGGEASRKASRKGAKNAKPGAEGRQAPSATLRVRVTDDQNQAVRDAKVAVRRSRDEKPRVVTTDKRGVAEPELPLNVYEVTVSHPKYPAVVVPKVRVVSEGVTEELVVTLTVGVEIKGRVTDEDGKPVPEVTIAGARRRLEHLARSGDVYLDDAGYTPQQTGSDGKFELQGVAAGRSTLEFSRHGYASELRTIQVGAGGAGQELKVVLRRPAVIRGRLLDESNQPVAGAKLQIFRYRPFHESGDDLSTFTATASTDTSGSFQMGKLLSEGAYDLRVDHPQYATAVFRNVAANTEDATWVLERGGEISGQVMYLDRETSPAQVMLTASTVLQGTTITRSLMTSRDGEFRFDHLPYAGYRFQVDYEGLVNEPQSPVVSIKNKPTTGVTVMVYEAGGITGTVVDAESLQGVAGAKVSSEAKYGWGKVRSRTFTTTADHNGRFSLNKLPGGQHSLVAKAQGYLPSNAGDYDQTLSLQPGGGQTDVLIEMSTGGIVEGFVRSPDGDGVPDAEVQLFNSGSTYGKLDSKKLNTKTDGLGHFVIRGFPIADRVQLYASAQKPGYAKARSGLLDVTRRIPKAVTEIHLSPGSAVTGRVTDTASVPLGGAKIVFESREFPGDPTSSKVTGETDGDGRYFLQNCTPGRSRLTASRAGYVTQTKSPTLKEDTVLEKQDFKLVQANNIRGVVADFRGNPIAGAKVSAYPLEKAVGQGSSTTNKKGEFNIGGLGKGFFRLEASFDQKLAEGKQTYTFLNRRVASGTAGVPIDCDLEPTLSGKVRGESKALNNFRVVLRSQLDKEQPQDFRFNLDRTYKNARGSFQIMKIPRGIYTLEVSADGYETYRNPDLVVGPGLRTTLPTIRLTGSGGIIGTVVSATTGRPINGVNIRVLDASRPESLTVSRLELGQYPRQDILEWLDSAFDDDDDLDPNRMFRPIARVRANVASSAKSDYSGRFVVTGVAPGPYMLEFESGEYGTVRLDNITVVRREPTDVGEVVMQPGGTVRGVVTDQDGNPVRDATVYARGESGAKKQTRTDAGGNYLFQGIRTGRVPIAVRTTLGSRTVYRFAFVEVIGEQTSYLNFSLDLAGSVRGNFAPLTGSVRAGGTVRFYPMDENGQPVADIRYDATLKSGGDFVLNSIPSGSYFVAASGSAPAGAFTWMQNVQVPRGGIAPRWQLGSGAVVVNATTAGGNAVSATRVVLQPDNRGMQLPSALLNYVSRGLNTNSSGRATFSYLQPGNYLVQSGGAAAEWLGVPPQQTIEYRLVVP